MENNKPKLVQIDDDYYINPNEIVSVSYDENQVKPWKVRRSDDRFTDMTNKQWDIICHYLDVDTMLYNANLEYDTKVFTEVERVYETRYDCKIKGASFMGR